MDVECPSQDGAEGVEVTLIRRWWPALLLVVLGAGGGVGAAVAQPPVYTAEARLVVGESSLSANMIPGFALATQEIASNYARFVTKPPVLQSLPAAVAREVKTVSASPIPSSNIVRVEATAMTESAALQAAAQASSGLVRQVSALSPEQSAANTLTRLGKLSRNMTASQDDVTEAQSQIGEYRDSSEDGSDTKLAAARERLARANARLSTLQAQQNALNALYQSQVGGPPQSSLQLVNSARVTGNDLMSRLQLYALGGAGIGGVIGLLIIRRRDGRSALAARENSSYRDERRPAPALSRGGGRVETHLVHLDEPREIPRGVPSQSSSYDARAGAAPSDSTQPLAAAGPRAEWEEFAPGRRRAVDSDDDWPARLRR